jgi:hypothetical protein
MLYLDLLKKCLTRSVLHDQRYEIPDTSHPLPYSHELREDGRDWPVEALTMVGVKRLEALQHLITSAIEHGIGGDVVECGVWRGGASIFMRGVLVALGHSHRSVWLYDSFAGLPAPKHASDVGLTMYNDYLAVPLSEVRENFKHFGLLSEHVKFVRGFFADTLPNAEVKQIALLRLDGDMYESTMIALESLYPKVSTGGYVVVDDYGAIAHCAKATNDFRAAHGITNPIVPIDWTGVYWQAG